MGLDLVPTGKNPPDEINVIIEIPKDAEPVKYEVDKASGAIFVDRVLSTPMRYPCNYGYVPHTLCGDGDPADVLVLMPLPLIPGSVIRCARSACCAWSTRPAPTRRSWPCRSARSPGLRPHPAHRRRAASTGSTASATSSSTTRTWRSRQVGQARRLGRPRRSPADADRVDRALRDDAPDKPKF